MNNDNTLQRTVIPGLIAAAVLALSFVHPVSPDKLVGAGTILFLLGIAALEYGPALKRMIRQGR
jgi:hypothetical protein